MSVEEEVLAAEEGLRLGDAGPDPDTGRAFEELLADDVLFIQSEGQTGGHKAVVVAAHRPPRGKTFSSVRLSEVLLRDLGSAVAVACRTDYTIGERAFAIRTLRLWQQRGTTWQVVVVALMGIP